MTELPQIPLAGVIGSPIAHSLSPLLHEFWLRRYGLPGFYVPMDIAHRHLKDAIRVLPTLGFVGVNVTIPHKELVLTLADVVTDRAALIGAANTLVFREDGRIHADNTDGFGFLENLRQNAPDWAPASGPAAVIGAGGAARAVVASLIDAGVPEIRLTNRTRARADVLKSDFGNKVSVFEWVQAANIFDGAATVINTTSLGMLGKPEFRIPLDALSASAVVNDLVYRPRDTQFLQRASEIGCVVVDGLDMLLHQAAPAFERFFGVRPEVDDDLREIVSR